MRCGCYSLFGNGQWAWCSVLKFVELVMLRRRKVCNRNVATIKFMRGARKSKKKKLPEIHLRGRCQALSVRLLLPATVSTHILCPGNAHPERRPAHSSFQSWVTCVPGINILCAVATPRRREGRYISIKINILCPCARLNCRFRVFNATQIDFVCNLTAHDCHMWHAPGCQQTQAQTERALK